ncbi:MAG: hypothetical protein MUQ65_16510 [Armatimonadetes bacterium]|nr:hypothetical protein [Armatimonadota bacterium]
MESSTSDVCEWCNRPMLPPGAAVSGKAAQELRESGQPLPGTGTEAPQEELGLPLSQHEPEEVDSAQEGDAAEASRQAAPEVHLRPLGDGAAQEAASPPPPPPQAAQGPSSGLSDEATRTSVDLSQYMGTDESIFRPIKREEEQSTGTADLRAQRRRKGGAFGEDKAPEITENTRLGRCLVAGLAVGVFFALAQFLITGNTVEVIYTSLRLGRGESFFTALKYGIASGLVFGFGLGALLVKFKKGSFFGLLAGIMVGLSVQNGLWAVIPAVITGIIAGKFATIGVRRIINV